MNEERLREMLRTTNLQIATQYRFQATNWSIVNVYYSEQILELLFEAKENIEKKLLIFC